jgi:plastocyanin
MRVIHPFVTILFLTLALGLSGCTSRKSDEPPKATETPVATAPGAAAYEGIDVAGGGSISGAVRFSGTMPKLEKRPVTKSPDICGHGFKPSEEVILGKAGALKNVVVRLEGIKRGKKIDTDSQPVLDQIKCDYIPHVQSVTAGSTLEIRNSDDLLHNVHGKLDGKATVFNLAMPLKDQRIPRPLAKPGIIALQCDAAHTWMRGYVVVVENPYHATTDGAGSFLLKDVPPGSYKLKAWHEKFGDLEQEVTVNSGAETKITFEYK